MSFKLFNGVTAVGVSDSIQVSKRFKDHTVQVTFDDYGVTAVSALVMNLQGCITNETGYTGLVSSPALAVGSTAENIANGAFVYRIAGTNYSKGAAAAGTALQTGYAITTAKYGVIMCYINASGTISYQFPATTQAYASVATAMAAGDAMVTTSDLCYIGRVLCYNNTGSEWNSQTDDLTTGGADITNAVFMDRSLDYITIKTATLSAGELAAQSATFSLTDVSVKRVRLYLSTLTGSGRVYGWYTPGAGI